MGTVVSRIVGLVSFWCFLGSASGFLMIEIYSRVEIKEIWCFDLEFLSLNAPTFFRLSYRFI